MARSITRWPTDEERQRIEGIIERHVDDRPEGVRRAEPTFSEDHTGYPAVFVTLFVDKNLEPTKEKIEELNDYVQVLIDDILEGDPDYWPYVRTQAE